MPERLMERKLKKKATPKQDGTDGYERCRRSGGQIFIQTDG
jgi:hypothetical protein